MCAKDLVAFQELAGFQTSRKPALASAAGMAALVPEMDSVATPRQSSKFADRL